MDEEVRPPTEAPGRDDSRALSRELTWGFGAVGGLAVLLSVVLLLMLLRVSAILDEVRGGGEAVREALSLSLMVREHYLHESDTVILGDDAQVERHEAWLEHLQRRAREQQEQVGPHERAELERLVIESAELDRDFREAVLPAALAGDGPRLRQAHAAAGLHLRHATEAADAVVAAVEGRLAAARRRAESATGIAVWTGVVGAALIVVLSFALAARLRRAISTPLARLADAARRVGRGGLDVEPVGELGRGEIRMLSRAFDAMAAQLREREREIVRSERLAAIGQLAAGVAHEINNPIGVIRGYLKTMIPEAQDEQLAEELRILDEEAAACQRIVEDLLAYGRDPSLRLEVVGARVFLEEAAARFSSADGGRPIQVHADTGKLQIDPQRLRQVIDNVLSNACQLSPKGASVELLGIALEEGGYRVEARDRGPGIRAEDRHRVFEPFRSGRPGGTGLGLAVSRVIVHAHRGTIEALPRDGGGTAIRIDLPHLEETP